MNRVALSLGAVLMALVAAIAFVATRPAGELTQVHREVAAAAEREVVAFLEVDHRDMEARVDAVMEGATGEFAEQYAARQDELVREAIENRSVSTAEVVAIGVGRLDGDSAEVLVAADTLVSNRRTEERAEPHYYRLRLSMVREGDRWLTAGLQVVR